MRWPVFLFIPVKNKGAKPVYYAQFKKPDGTYTTARSTRCTNNRAAVKWCEEELRLNGVPMPGRDITLDAYSKNFFSWNGNWATDRKTEGKRIGQRHCRDRMDAMRLHVLPVFGQHYLTDIDKAAIKAFRNDLYTRGYSGSVINKCLCTQGNP